MGLCGISVRFRVCLGVWCLMFDVCLFVYDCMNR